MSRALQQLRAMHNEHIKSQCSFMEHDAALLVEISEQIIMRLNAGNKILIAGNGGSASQASHFATELIGRFRKDRDPIPAIPLTDTSVITAVGNDYGFENIFDRQLYALARPGDVFIALSTSGNSPNIIQATKTAIWQQCYTMGLSGPAGQLSMLCDECIKIKGSTPAIQEAHLFVLHALAGLIENSISRHN